MTREEKIAHANDLAELIGLMPTEQCLDTPNCYGRGNCESCEIDRTIQEFLDFLFTEFPDGVDNDFVSGMVYSTLDNGKPLEIVDEGDPYDYY